MHNRNSYVLIGVAAAATALASTAQAGGEAGRLELRDLGAKFVGYHDARARITARSTC